MPEMQRQVKLTAMVGTLVGIIIYLVQQHLVGNVHLETLVITIGMASLPVVYALLNEAPASVMQLFGVFLGIVRDAMDGKIDDEEQLQRLELLLKQVVREWNNKFRAEQEKSRQNQESALPSSETDGSGSED